MILFLVVYLIPLGYSLVRSVFRKQTSGIGIGPPTDVFVGLANYVDVVTSPVFWEGILRVFGYGLIQIPVMLVVAMAIALLIDSRAARGRGVFRLSSFLPYAIPGIVASLLWAYLYVPQLSPVIQLVQSWGWDIDLLGAPTVLFSIANIAIWSWAGYNVIIYTAALQSIPKEVIEAAQIDGANGWVLAMRIKAPLIRGPIALTALLSTIGSIQLFNEPVVLRTITTAIGAEWTPMMLAYNATFAANNFERGSAISVLIAIIAGILAIVYRKLSTRGSES
ncbi:MULTISPECIES: carbohydrate ABC transporter permease [Microbacterium]|uniref:Sugar ABC transporter permease n=1 Tax=Microbacterium wangchenii TaxID=2541726 RepID=A0ABX5ST79_9MICO|nr:MULTISPECIES: sugar ABC transporter permease [Microbacterium]MCK6064903.1 sugar ABC transporter permease [Microbacterium sp. EYE_512]QBR88387.1 sugar ABC transporter permease [Microbacterium wangchenii]TFV82562.1 sugar ABC transporter permease [Microbacterium sp. dk485]TXK20113.1 sugar ABC transporter permease [Microbacterium wangchenii]